MIIFAFAIIILYFYKHTITDARKLNAFARKSINKQRRKPHTVCVSNKKRITIISYSLDIHWSSLTHMLPPLGLATFNCQNQSNPCYFPTFDNN